MSKRKPRGKQKYGKRNNSHNSANADNGQQLYDAEGKGYADDKGYKGSGKGSKRNDPNWYTTNQSLIESTANIPFNQISGLQLDRDWSNFPTDNIDTTAPFNAVPINTALYNSNVIPGIMALDIVPAIGCASNPSDPINMSSLAMYSYIRHSNSGTAYGDPADTMLFMIAMSQVYSYINWLQRIYGTVSLYSQVNRYIPVGVAYAQRVDYNDLTANLANFRYGINLLINKAAAFAVPSSFTYFNRQAFLFSNFYIDGDSMRDQMYILNPAGFWFYQEGQESQPMGQLIYKTILSFLGGQNALTTDMLLDIGNQMIGSLLGSEDIGIISGNILKAFGDSNVIKLAPLPEDYTLIPVYDVGVLEQIRNATILSVGGLSIPSVSNNITQIVNINNGAIVYKPTAVYSFPSAITKLTSDEENALVSALVSNLYTNRLFLTGSPSPTIGDVIENSRLMVGYEQDTGVDISYSSPDASGKVRLSLSIGLHPASDYIITARVISSNLTSAQTLGTGFNAWYRHGLNLLPGSGSGTLVSLLRSASTALADILRESKFDFRPRLNNMTISVGTGGLEVRYMGEDVEIENFTVIENTVLNRLTDACLVNEFYVPSVGSL